MKIILVKIAAALTLSALCAFGVASIKAADAKKNNIKKNNGTAVLKYSSPHANLPPGFTIRHPKDGAEMVWIPEGYFRMGINAKTAQAQAEQLGYKHYHEIAGEESFPERMVYVQGFFMDKYEVTFERWKKF